MSDPGVDPELTGTFEADVTETSEGSIYPRGTEFVKIEYDRDGYYMITCLDEDLNQIRDNEYDGHRNESRIHSALLGSEPKYKYNIMVPE